MIGRPYKHSHWSVDLGPRWVMEGHVSVDSYKVRALWQGHVTCKDLLWKGRRTSWNWRGVCWEKEWPWWPSHPGHLWRRMSTTNVQDQRQEDNFYLGLQFVKHWPALPFSVYEEITAFDLPSVTLPLWFAIGLPLVCHSLHMCRYSQVMCGLHDLGIAQIPVCWH